MALRAACSGLKIIENTHTAQPPSRSQASMLFSQIQQFLLMLPLYSCVALPTRVKLHAQRPEPTLNRISDIAMQANKLPGQAVRSLLQRW